MVRISGSQIGCFGWLRRIANGVLVCVTLPLLSLKGFTWNHKRVYRIYPELELNLRIKPKKRIVRERPDPLSVPTAVNQVWSIDFISDALASGRKLCTFYVLDDYNREGLGIEADLLSPLARITRSFERIIEWRSNPAAIRYENGSELSAETLV